MKRIVKEGSRAPGLEDEAVVELAEQPTNSSSSPRAEESPRVPPVEVGGATLTMYDNVRRDGSWKDRGPTCPPPS